MGPSKEMVLNFAMEGEACPLGCANQGLPNTPAKPCLMALKHMPVELTLP